MNNISQSELNAHMDLLREKVFQVDNKWPHFKQLLNAVENISGSLEEGKTVVSLERGLLYGGYSLIAPFFHKQNFISIDCSPESADERASYNKGLVEDERFLKVESSERCQIEELSIDDDIADYILVPNLVHHIADQNKLFQEISRLTKPGGKVFIFEPLIRELHQIPDDYLRYTPFGMINLLKQVGLNVDNYELEGGPFSVIAYCWEQALQYFPDEKRKEMEKWFYNEHFAELMKWDEEYTENLFRQHTKFPMSFCVYANKSI